MADDGEYPGAVTIVSAETNLSNDVELDVSTVLGTYPAADGTPKQGVPLQFLKEHPELYGLQSTRCTSGNWTTCCC